MESHFLRKFSGIEKKLTHGATLLLASLEEAKLGCFATSLAPLEINISSHNNSNFDLILLKLKSYLHYQLQASILILITMKNRLRDLLKVNCG